MIKKGLEDLIEKAIDFGFNATEVGLIRRHYYDALIKYDEAHKDNQPRGTRGYIEYNEVRQMTAYAVVKAYMRKEVDRFQKEAENRRNNG